MSSIPNDSSTKQASNWNPFQGTVKKGETSKEGIQLPGLGKVTKDNSFGNFTLRKIYNSIKYAPGHALLACGRFFGYLYADNNADNNNTLKTFDNPLARAPTEKSSSTEESSFKKLTNFLYPTRTVQNFIHSQPDLFTLDKSSMERHNQLTKDYQNTKPLTKAELDQARDLWLKFNDRDIVGHFNNKLKSFYQKNDLANRTNKEPQTDKEIKDAEELFLLYKNCLDLENTDGQPDQESEGNKINTARNIFHLIPPSFLEALKVKES
jgi:hypothetical protein